MEEVLYELKPYAILVIGVSNIGGTTPWWGTLSGLALIFLGGFIWWMRHEYRSGRW